MKKYRPKQCVVYLYGTTHKAAITCKPQSRWRLINKINNKVILANKHTTICLTTEDFETRWVEVKKRKRYENENND